MCTILNITIRTSNSLKQGKIRFYRPDPKVFQCSQYGAVLQVWKHFGVDQTNTNDILKYGDFGLKGLKKYHQHFVCYLQFIHGGYNDRYYVL